MKISEAKLNKLKAHLEAGGDTDDDTLKAILGTTSDNVVKAYRGALGETDDEEDDDGYVYYLQDDSGVLSDLELFKHKGNKLIFRKQAPVEPVENVELLIKGKIRTYDLVQLRKKSLTETVDGVTVEKLLLLAEVASE